MIYSMTGYGKAEAFINELNIIVEIKSLNGKQLDTRLYIPPELKKYEIEIRNLISKQLERGSIEATIQLKKDGHAQNAHINTAVVKTYYKQLKSIAVDLGADITQLLNNILKLPEVFSTNASAFLPEEEELLFSTIRKACNELEQHRKTEGNAMEIDFIHRIKDIESLAEKIALIAPLRNEKRKQELKKILTENMGEESYNENRLEQELIYYIEKNDISEEIVRLANHCSYFIELLDNKEKSKGKILSFLLQEMGREINTIGSKANDAAIQRDVVKMKDELEKMKEQVSNIL